MVFNLPLSQPIKSWPTTACIKDTLSISQVAVKILRHQIPEQSRSLDSMKFSLVELKMILYQTPSEVQLALDLPLMSTLLLRRKAVKAVMSY